MNQLFGLFLFVSFLNPLSAQDNGTSVLNKKVTIKAKDERVRTILKEIEKQAGKNFSYNSKIIDPQKRKTIVAEEKTIAETIELLFEDKVSCKVKGNYIVLYKPATNAKLTSDAKPQTLQKVQTDSHQKVQTDSRHYLKPSSTKNDTIVRYFIDVITKNAEGKDSVIQTESILVPTSHTLKVKDDSTLIMLEKDVLTPKKNER